MSHDNFLQVTISGKKIEIYTHSYLGLGLKAARTAIFTQGNTANAIDNNTNNSEVIKLTSPCMATSKPQPWSYGGSNYLISGPRKKPTYKKCLNVVRKVLKAKKVHVPVELQHHNVAVFSSFYDCAIDSGILPAGATKGSTKVKSFIKAAKKACYKNVPKTAGFLCVDLTYIVGLLMDGYGLKPEKEIQIFKKIDGHEVSWALGVAYSLSGGNFVI
jgi:ectonucleoside triphosphate diphosphohydrolase 5/6